MVDARLSPDGRTLTVRVPLKFRQSGGRKLIIAPDGTTTPAAPRTQTVNALVKALVNAHRWQRMLDSGEYATVGELAAALRFNPSHLSRILRLSLLAPDLVEAILDGRRSAEVTLAKLM